jgi:hypothetical protein
MREDPKGTGEAVVFLAHIKRGFGVPAGDFFHGLLYFYRIKVVHLVPNAIVGVLDRQPTTGSTRSR